MLTDPTNSHFTLSDTLSGISITWQGQRDWSRFTGNALTILINLLAIGVIAYYTSVGAFGDMTTRIVTLFVLTFVGMYLLYRVYRRLQDLTGALLHHESIQIDDQAVTIERSGFLNMERKVAYPADRIQSIRSTTGGSNRSLFLSFKLGGDALTRYGLGNDQVFCRGISEADATTVLGKIHDRFPQYRDVKP
jgi:hypothetical protein